jgi:hypothetical protein
MEVDKIMRALLTLGATRAFVHFHVFVEYSSLPLVLVMFSLFCPLLCLRGVLELHLVLVKIMRTLLTLGANSSTPRRHGSRQNNESITNTRCNSSTPRRHGSGQNNENFVPSVSNVLIILSTSMSSWNARVCP